jgi:hypothetical protein
MRINDQTQQTSPLLKLQQINRQQVNVRAVAQFSDSSEGISKETADQMRFMEENLKRVAAQVAIDTKKEYSVQTFNFGTTSSTNGLDLRAVDTTDSNQAISAQTQTTDAVNTQSQAETSGRNAAKIQGLQNRLQSTMQANAAGAYAAVDKATQTNANALTNSRSAVSDANVKEEAEKFYQQTLANGQLQQAGVAKLGMANQSVPQVLSLFG